MMIGQGLEGGSYTGLTLPPFFSTKKKKEEEKTCASLASNACTKLNEHTVIKRVTDSAMERPVALTEHQCRLMDTSRLAKVTIEFE